MSGETKKAQNAPVASGEQKRKRNVWTIVLVLASVVLVGSLVALGLIGFSYFQGQQKYEKLEEYVAPTQPEEGDGEKGGPSVLTVDWSSLIAKNPDTVAWLYAPGTAVNYPVVRGADNDYYLTHDFDGDQGWLANFGAVFMDYRNQPNWSDAGYFIYGHHMNDGSMFADFAGMGDQARFDECRTVYLMSPQGDFKLRTFAFIRCAPDEEIVQQNFTTREELTKYVQDKMNRSLVKVPDAPPADKVPKFFAFATCDNVVDGRFILYAYIEASSAEGLEGVVGASENEEGSTEMVSDLHEGQ